ncbi:hypothetical protein H5410_006345 [Solanum commersonii]|uniref:Uncharacterized protein n=1 Tax=Solanum commersonii TaxID=4109 RepID=A0A9J6AB18_SOLCO|nr:hypothetical protein H5410_006345 [Solanum commersonii]
MTDIPANMKKHLQLSLLTSLTKISNSFQTLSSCFFTESEILTTSSSQFSSMPKFLLTSLNRNSASSGEFETLCIISLPSLRRPFIINRLGDSGILRMSIAKKTEGIAARPNIILQPILRGNPAKT